jgi:hypothetical protein
MCRHIRHNIAKGFNHPSHGLAENAMPPGWCCCLDSKDREHGDDHTSGIIAGMAEKFNVDVCRYTRHIVVKGFDHRSTRSAGNTVPTGAWMAGREDSDMIQGETTLELDRVSI